MQCDSVDTTCKVIVVGNGEVGKSSMLTRYCKGEFTEDYKKTIGTDYMQKRLYMDDLGQEIQLDLWDTAGQEVFAQLTASYYRGCGACALAFSTIDRDSFEAIEKWKTKVEHEVDPPPVMCLVQTKMDLVEQATVQNDEADHLASRLGLHFIKISTKENFNVDKVFMYLAKAWLSSGRDTAGEAAAAIHSGGGEAAKKAAKEGFTSETPKITLSDNTDKTKTRATRKKRKICTIL